MIGLTRKAAIGLLKATPEDSTLLKPKLKIKKKLN